MKVGDRVKFKSEKFRYTVQACNKRFVVCTKPFNLEKTVLYTIIDFARNIRGEEGLVFCLGFETREKCEEALERLMRGESEVSYRNYRELDIENFYRPPTQNMVTLVDD